MNATDQEKLCKAGYLILRAEDRGDKHIIKMKTVVQPRAWVFHSEYPTKVARDRVLQHMLEDPKTIED